MDTQKMQIMGLYKAKLLKKLQIAKSLLDCWTKECQ